MPDISNFFLYISLFISLYFEVFLLINFIEKLGTLKTEEARIPHIFPSVTIIVPVYNEEDTVTKTVFSLLKLEYPKEKLRIIIVNDGSTDSTANVLKRFRGNKRIEIINKKNGGKYTALNAGIKRTTSDLVGCLDADSFVLPDTLKKMIPYFESEKIMAVTPAIKIYEPDRFVRHIQSNEYDLGIFMKKCFSQIESVTVTPGPFSIFRKKVFDVLGPFKEAYNTEDLEIALRMQKNFYGIANAHNAVVYTVGPSSFQKLHRQRVRWVQGFLANSFDYRSLFFNRRHGHLGVFAFPFSLINVGLLLLAVILTLWSLGNSLGNKLSEIQLIGWHWPNLNFRFDWFYFNTDSAVFLSLLLFIGTIVLTVCGKKLSEKKMGISVHTFYFPFVYAFFSVFWVSKAIYNTALAKESPWR